MSASQFGANLLAEVEEMSLDELIRDLQYVLGQSEERVWTGVRPIDRLLNIVLLEPLDDGQEQHGLNDDDLEGDTSLALDSHATSSNLRAKSALIEINYSQSVTGKINLIYYLTALAVLPSNCGGREACVVWLDTTQSFSAKRLHKICMACIRVSPSSTRLSNVEINDQAKQALKHVHVFSIQSTKQLLHVLDKLPSYLLQTDSTPFGGEAKVAGQNDGEEKEALDLPTHQSTHRPLSLILLDSATSFHWSDQYNAEIARLEAIGSDSTVITQGTRTRIGTRTQDNTGSTASSSSSSQTTRIITTLESLAKNFNSTVIYTTNHSLTTLPPAPPGQPPPQQHVQQQQQPPQPPPQSQFTPIQSQYTTHSTLSLTLHPLPTLQFPPSMSIIPECLHDQPKRLAVVSKNKVRVTVNPTWLNDTRIMNKRKREQIVEKLKKLTGDGGFVVGNVVDGGGNGGGGVEIE